MSHSYWLDFKYSYYSTIAWPRLMTTVTSNVRYTLAFSGTAATNFSIKQI